jgi:SAM-dependent methyltransferase
MEAGFQFKCAAVEEAASLILREFRDSPAYMYPMRFGLAIGQRVCFQSISLNAPSLDIGVNDGSTAAVIHYGKPRFTWGGDMPEERTYESMGLFVSPEYNVYENLIGLDVSGAVPFPDESFNTVSATEVFSYGIDRDRTLSELCRVLAPGGTIAFSDTAEDILRFPAIERGLKQYVTSLDVLEDSQGYYRRRLSELGLVQIETRLYFARPLAGLLHALMYASDPAADHTRQRRLWVEDAVIGDVYTQGLMTIASALDDEFSRTEGPADGWHVFVSARKPGSLDLSLPTPHPWCPACNSRSLETSLLECRCSDCGRSYMTRFATPYLLLDNNTAYSPKQQRPAHLAADVVALDRQIDAVLRSSYTALRDLAPGARVQLFGINQATAFTIRHLREHGLTVEAVGTDVGRLVGEQIEGVRIVGLPDLAPDVPLLLGPDPRSVPDVIETLRTYGYSGLVISLAQSSAAGAVPLVVLPLDSTPRGSVPTAEAEAEGQPTALRRLARRVLHRSIRTRIAWVVRRVRL